MNWEPAQPPAALHSWLAETGSLTARLEANFGAINVDIQFEGEAPLYPYEQQALDTQHAWVREVILRQQETGTPLLWARTCIPEMQNPANPWQKVPKIGQKPLGNLLFGLKNLKSTAFSQGKIFENQKKGETPVWHNRWGRWRILYQYDFPLLLTEVFLFYE